MKIGTWLNRALCMGLFAAAAVPMAGFAAAASAGTVIDTRVGPGGHTYRLVDDNDANWSTARDRAAADGGHLVVINDAAEQSFVEKLLKGNDVEGGAYWIGLQEGSAEGSYGWVNGDPLGYEHWLKTPPQPDNSGGNETVGSILWGGANDVGGALERRGFWNDLPNESYPEEAGKRMELVKSGYFVEYAGAVGSGASLGGGSGTGGSGGPQPIPLPAAAFAFPLGAAVAGYAAHRMRRAQAAR
jgi:hypothetical protein